MKRIWAHFSYVLFGLFFILSDCFSDVELKKGKIKIAIVSSYHPEYLWSQQTSMGVSQGLLDFGYIERLEEGERINRLPIHESKFAMIKKWWMDSKRKSSRAEIAASLFRIVSELERFRPHIILLGDDNAANYIGNHYLDTEIPIVFWGINGIPLKYDLLDSIEKPGHNVTGVYQAGYYLDCVAYLKKLFPNIKSMAVLSDDSPSGRAHAKKIRRFAEQGLLGVELKKVVVTNSFYQWKREALELQNKVDAFFILPHHTLKDLDGKHVNYLTAAAWYLNNINKPEVTPTSFYVKEGFFSTVDDSAFNQGYEAVKIAHQIITQQAEPADIASYAPQRGPFIVNRWRAKVLGVEQVLNSHLPIIDKWVDDSAAMHSNNNTGL